MKPHDWKIVGDKEAYSHARLYKCDGCGISVWADWFEDETPEAVSQKWKIPQDCELAVVKVVLDS